MKKSELINWYLKEVESEIETEEELINRKHLLDKVLARLIHHVCMNSALQMLDFDR